MYARFFRWASDRLDENGIRRLRHQSKLLSIAVPSMGFERLLQAILMKSELSILAVTSGQIRNFPERSIMSLAFRPVWRSVSMVKRAKSKGCRIFYARRPEFESADEKLAFLGGQGYVTVTFEEVKPDCKKNWIEQGDNEFDSLLPLLDQDSKEFKIDRSESDLLSVFLASYQSTR